MRNIDEYPFVLGWGADNNPSPLVISFQDGSYERYAFASYQELTFVRENYLEPLLAKIRSSKEGKR